MKSDPKIAAMSKVPLFARCSKRELETIASLADEVDLPAGKVLTAEGDRGREFFVLLEGLGIVTPSRPAVPSAAARRGVDVRVVGGTHG